MKLLDQFSTRKRNQYHSCSTIGTPNTQSSKGDHENVIEMPGTFYRQVTYDEKLQAYVSVDTKAKVPAEASMYVIFHEPTKRYFRCNPTINHFKLNEAKDCDWTTRYLLCRDYILSTNDNLN